MKLKIISIVTTIITGTHYLRKSLSNCLKNGSKSKITDNMIVEMNILQTNWQRQMS